MRNALLIRVGPAGSATCSWLRLDTTGSPQGELQTGTFEAAAAAAGGLRAVLLVPGLDVLLTTVQLPGIGRQKLLRAVPYALEEQLSEDVDTLHFAVGRVQPDGHHPVAVIADQRMAELLEAAGAAGLDVQQMLPDLLAIPRAEGEISVLLDGAIALVRTGDYSGFAVDSDNLGMLLGAQEAANETPAVLRLLAPEGSPLPDMTDYAGDTQVEPYRDDPLQVLVRGLGTPVIDLMQGTYSRAGEWGRVWRPWRATAALLLVGVLVSYGVMAMDYFRLDREHDELTARIEQSYRDAFPGAKRVVNPRVQMQQQLDQLQRRQGTGNRFLSLLSRSGKVLNGVQGTEITGVNFRGGKLDMDLTVADLQLLDKLKQQLAEGTGLAVEIQSATASSDKRVRSRLRIEDNRS